MSGKLKRTVPRLSLSKAEAAESMGVSVRHFQRHIQPHVPVVYSGQLTLYPIRGLQEFIDKEAIRLHRSAA